MYENLRYYLILTITYAVSGIFVVSKTQSSNKETKNYTSLWINGMKIRREGKRLITLKPEGLKVGQKGAKITTELE